MNVMLVIIKKYFAKSVFIPLKCISAVFESLVALWYHYLKLSSNLRYERSELCKFVYIIF